MPVNLAKPVDLNKRPAVAPVIVATVDMGTRPVCLARMVQA